MALHGSGGALGGALAGADLDCPVAVAGAGLDGRDDVAVELEECGGGAGACGWVVECGHAALESDGARPER